MKQYSEFIGKHEGEVGFVLGAGTSLFNITRHKKYKEIFNHVVVSINSSILATEWQEGSAEKRYWTSNDVCCLHWSYFWNNVLKSNCNKLIRDSWKHKHEEFAEHIDSFYEFSPRSGWEGASKSINELMYGEGVKEPATEEEQDEAIKENEIGLCCISSIPSAIDFSIQAGCKKIFLLGVDHYTLGRRSHFWEFFHRTKQPFVMPGGFKATHLMQKAMFKENMKTYSSLDRFANKKGAQIYLCNPKSKVECYQKIDFDDIFGLI